MTVADVALERAAEMLASAFGVARVARLALGAEEGETEPVGETALVAALSNGQSVETGYCMGADRPFEFEHVAALELVLTGGDPDARNERRRALIDCAAAAIAAEPTLGGLVDYAEIGGADPSDEVRYLSLAATLTLTYTAPNALG